MKLRSLSILLMLLSRKCNSSESERKLIEHIMSNYTPDVRPVQDNKDVVMTKFQVALQQIVDLDEKNQLLSTSLYMTNEWKDSKLVWNPTDYDNITTIRLPAKKVWKPDIYVYNSAVDSFDSLLHTNVIIYHDGNVSWLPPGIFKTTCEVDIRYFPFDEQKCKIKFGSWTHQDDSLDLHLADNGTADTSAYQKSGEWDLIGMEGKINKLQYDCCEGKFVDATYTITMRRQTAFYIYNLVLPCVLVCALTILTFIFPADAGERMTLGITVLLAMVVFLQIVADNLPPTGDTPLLGKYFLCSVFMVSLSVIASVFSMSLHHSSPSNTDDMPVWFESLFLNCLPRLLFMKIPKNFSKKSPKRAKYPQEDMSLQQLVEKLSGSYHDSHGEEMSGIQSNLSEKIAKMCDDLHDIVARMEETDEDEKITEKWKFSARVLDRFCLVFFILFFVLSTVFTICLVPSREH